ncbi:TolB-like protein [Rhizobium sp. BK529]|uniref:hypothetical protein n=1 Tax=Rhizobium sp. BK529 TaxID=2586983 RepID=UPI001622F097|nr:hypothetical protein [Rhizobium sp. BK529]MBB3595997.1 TolB-like protein [Rhizobium sp. BK529]
MAELDRQASIPPNLAPEEVRHQLERILVSSDLNRSKRIQTLLSFVVTETLEGRSKYLKAYSIALAIFNRDNSFDPQTDPCVRTAAMRLRSELEMYYLTLGKEDPVLIDIPKGTYVPVFARKACEGCQVASDAHRKSQGDCPFHPLPARVPLRLPPMLNRRLALASMGMLLLAVASGSFGPASVSSVPATTYGLPVVRVEPFEALPETAPNLMFAQGLTDSVVAKLAQDPKMVVQVVIGVKAPPPTYRLEGRVRTEESAVWTSLRLTRNADDTIVWATTVKGNVQQGNFWGTQTQLSQEVAARIAGNHGIIN